MTVICPSLEETLGLMILAQRQQFGSQDEAVREGLAYVVATHFEALRLLRHGKDYESELLESDLEDMWISVSQDLVQIRKRFPIFSWN